MKLKLRTGILLVLGIMLIFSVPLIAQDQEEEDYTFRKTRWGMSKSEVIEQEGKPDLRRDTTSGGYTAHLIYEGLTVGGLEASLGYLFTEDKLVRGVYLFEESHTNKNLYIEDYKEVKKILTDKYGQPETEGPVWSNELYKGDTDQYGFAISIGELKYQSIWETEKTEIWNILDGDNYSVSHGLYYDSRRLMELVEKKREERSQSQF